ncbi:MAG: hypothetical protein ACYCTB_02475 [bacterium]
MKKIILVALAVFLIIFAAYFFNSIAYAKGKLSKKMIAKEKIHAALKIGKSMFYSPKLGSDGLSCAKCHVYSIGTYLPKVGKTVRSLAGVAATFPKFDAKTHQVITMGERINMCIVHVLKGKPLTGQKLNYLTLYLTYLSNGYKIK